VLTLGALITVPNFRRAWRGERAMLPIPYGLGRLMRNPLGRQRAGGALLISAYVLCAAGWLVVFDLADDTVALRLLAALGSLAWVLSVAAVVTAYAIAQPRFLVPPGLR
jgi:hypothetical protein